MKTKLLPLAALLSLTAMTSVQAAPYVTDGYGNIARDSFGECVRTSTWTQADAALCTAPEASSAAKNAAANKSKTASATSAPVELNIEAGDIETNAKGAYVVDSNGNVVRDSWNRCVRTNYWTMEKAINKCEGIEDPKPAAPVVVAPAPAPEPVVVETIVDDVPAAFRGFFETDKADLKPAAHEKLDTYADYLTRHPAKHVQVVGHTDATGTAAYNQLLSEKRAAAVAKYLIGKDIALDRIEASGKGLTMPVATNKTKEGRAENRRVEIKIITTK